MPSIVELLRSIYPNYDCDQLAEKIEQRMHRAKIPQFHSKELWSEEDVILITYGDHVQSTKVNPLQALSEFLHESDLMSVLSCVHILPFFPYSSDDGFSVIDYKQVNPELGSWSNIQNLADNFDLMFDLVLNHISQHSAWFKNYLKNIAPFDRYFIEHEDGVDYSKVVRPRASDLFTEFETTCGLRKVWTTFGPDQVDLNFANPKVALEMIDVFLFYLEQGARIIRLDAIAFLWKESNTDCLHRPQTHAFVKLLRQVATSLQPSSLILTETNVPHDENISYFGKGDEAQMIYQFSLAPLLLDAYNQADGEALTRWANEAYVLQNGTTVLNFTASHDGIGVRPLQGLISEKRFDTLVETTKERGGYVSYRSLGNGHKHPYELNCTYFQAIADPSLDDSLNIKRFMGSQAVMLSLKGIPGIYFSSLFGMKNWTAGYELTRHNRAVNRRKFQISELLTRYAKDPLHGQIFETYVKLLAIRRQQKVFHPDSLQKILSVDRRCFCFQRSARADKPGIVCVYNLTNGIVDLDLSKVDLGYRGTSIIDDRQVDLTRLKLDAYDFAWIHIDA